MRAKNYGIDFTKIRKSDCKSSGKEVYSSPDKINSVFITDSNVIIDFNLCDNCCYDFLCDISVDSNNYLNLLYTGYGSYCGCNCCFGLEYELIVFNLKNFKKIKGVTLNGKIETLFLIGFNK